MPPFDQYEADREAIRRRRAVAEALMAQSQQPLAAMPQGAIASHRSPLEGVAQVARAYMGRRGMEKADAETRDLGERQRSDVAEALAGFQRETEPRPAEPAGLVEDPAGIHETDARPAFAPDAAAKRAAALKYMSSVGDPATAGRLLVAEALKPPPATKYHTVGQSLVPEPAPGAAGPVEPVYTAPEKPEKEPEQIRVFKESMKLAGIAEGSPQYQAALQDFTNKITSHPKPSTAKATATATAPGVEKKYGEQFAGLAAKSDIDMLEAARKAPDLAERSNRILEVVSSGKVIAGAGADFRLALGKAMNLAGAGDQEVIANTEALATDLAKNTLDSIKASGLGGGTGFSNADRDFLEKAVGGKITLEGATISRLATLAHRAAENTAKRWAERAAAIPDTALEGTGIKRDPIPVPPMFGIKPAPRRQLSPAAQRYLDEAQ